MAGSIKLPGFTAGIRLGDFVRLKDGTIARVYSAWKVEDLRGNKTTVIEGEVARVTYSPEYSLLVNAVFDLATRVCALEV